MIEKVISLRGVGLLHQPLQSGAMSLSKTVAIYSDNGRGKSTFSCVCRSIVDNDCEEVSARRTIGGAASPCAEFLIDGMKHTLAEGAWDQTSQALRVFDAEFVERNVCSGMRVEPSHRERLLEFALGQKAARLKRDIDALVERIDAQNKAIRTARLAIEGQTAPFTLDEFVALPDEPPTAAEFAAADRALRDAENASVIAARPLLEQLVVPAIDTNGLAQVLARTLHGIEEEAEKRVRAHVRDHLADGGEQWLRRGMEFAQSDMCPFCGQDLKGLVLVDAYRGFFSALYEELVGQIAAERRAIDETFTDERLDALAGGLSRIAEVTAAWSDQQVAIPAAPSDVLDACRRAKSELVRLVEMKANSPLLAISVDERAQEALDLLATRRETVEEFNRTASEVNRQLQAIQAASASADQTQLRAVRDRLAARERRSSLSGQCTAYSAAKSLKQGMDAEKATKRSELTAMTGELLDCYSGAINDRLKAFGADFEVAKFTRSDAGGTPRAAYVLRLMGEDIPLTADGEKPSFSTTLSEGDRRLLGLCFFLASLDNDAGIAESTVVIDDPVCSFDIYRRSKMVEAIGQLVSRGAQVIVLSHDADFIRMLRDAGFDMICELHRAGSFCVFDECNIDAVCESEYVANYRELAGYLVDGRPEAELRGIAKRVRPYLETNLHHRFPIEFASAENLGKMIGAIKNRSASSPLGCLDGEIGDLEQVNEYSSPYHHDEGQKPLDRELQKIVELALTLGRN